MRHVRAENFIPLRSVLLQLFRFVEELLGQGQQPDIEILKPNHDHVNNLAKVSPA